MTGDIFLSLGASVYLVALLFKDVVYLRVSALIATTFYFGYANYTGFFSMQIWQLLFIALNGYHIARLIQQRLPITLPKPLQSVYDAQFSNMSKKEFLRFWSFGDDINYENEYLINEGIAVKSLWYLKSGEAQVAKAQQILTRLHQGQFLGEMSFLKKTTASADVFASEGVMTRCWSQEKLKDYCALNPGQKQKLYSILAQDLSKKVSLS